MRTRLLAGLICCSALLATAGELLDLQGLIDQQIASGETTVVIPPGRYRVKPQNRSHLMFKGLSDITVIADGVEMICTETTRAVTIESCTNLTLRGMVIDYDPLPYTQGRIVSFSPDRTTCDIERMEGYPSFEKAINSKYAVYDDVTRTCLYGAYHQFEIEKLSPTRLRFIKTGSSIRDRKDGGEEIGDLITINIAQVPGGYMPHAVFSDHSVRCTIEKITLFASPTFAFMEDHCDGTTYLNCRLDRRPPETDLVKRFPRLLASNADAFHSKFAVKGPQILGCYAHWQGDDCVNICGAYHFITEAHEDTLRVLAKNDMDIQPGDPVELITADGKRLPDANVVSVKPVGPTTDDERARMKKTRLLARIQGFLNDAYEIKLDRSADIPFASIICSMNRRGDGFAVKDCWFGDNRSKGIMVKGSNGEISGNRVENCALQGIKIAPEYHWLESGYSRNVMIRDNTVVNSGSSAVWVHAFGDYAAHGNITITNNVFRSDAEPLIAIEGLNGGLIAGNISQRMDFSPVESPVSLTACTNVTVLIKK